jgi:hypothetical protein
MINKPRPSTQPAPPKRFQDALCLPLRGAWRSGLDSVGEDGASGSPCGREATKYQKKQKRKPIETESITSRAMEIGTIEDMILRRSEDVTLLESPCLRIPIRSRIRLRIAAIKAARPDEKMKTARLSSVSVSATAGNKPRNVHVNTSHGEKEYR